eukprot:SM000269S09902  [mRNA]  locus=s269:42495:44567:+ [translate_table: standard]
MRRATARMAPPVLPPAETAPSTASEEDDAEEDADEEELEEEEGGEGEEQEEEEEEEHEEEEEDEGGGEDEGREGAAASRSAAAAAVDERLADSGGGGDGARKRRKRGDGLPAAPPPAPFPAHRAGGGGSDERKVFAGGFPYNASEEDIHDFFAECGVIEGIEYVLFPDTGRFKGIAFITFKTALAAKKAVALDGADMGGRYLKIAHCKPRAGQEQKLVHAEPPKKTTGCLTAFIANLSWDIDEETVRRFFKGCKIEAVRFVLDKTTGDFKGCGHVDFSDDASLEKALTMDQQEVLGRPMKVAYAVIKGGQRGSDSQGNGRGDCGSQGGIGGSGSGAGDERKRARGKGCFLCGQAGHKSFDCPQKAR